MKVSAKSGGRAQGFTLIEMMIAVAIIGILATTAIPNFMRFQLRAKALEGKINLSSIRMAQRGYFAELGRYVAWSPVPSALPRQTKRSWDLECSRPVSSNDPALCELGWQPEGDTYFQYGANTTRRDNGFFAEARSDIDADGNVNLWGVDSPNRSGSRAVPTHCTDVLNPITGHEMFNQVGPCDSVQNGRNIF